jgi:hypothetical protein
MVQPRGPELSDSLSQMSQQAKKVEDAFADLAQKTDAAAAERNTQVQAEWRALQVGIDREIKAMQADMAIRKYARDVRQAEEHAKAGQTRADWTASYAVTVAEMARLAALDSDVARREADALKRQ